jgi:hypothetical protein
MTTKTYTMYEGLEATGTQQAARPADALTAEFGQRLATTNGRYGTLKDGTHVAAFVNLSRAYYGRGAMDPETGRRG